MNAKELLKKQNLRVTQHRLTVVDLLLNNNHAVPFSTIQTAAKEMDRVTLYRTIDTLVQNGVIHKAYADKSDTHYALCDHQQCSHHAHEHNHIHFKCTNCETVSCVDVKPNFELSIPNVKISTISILADGICAECS